MLHARGAELKMHVASLHARRSEAEAAMKDILMAVTARIRNFSRLFLFFILKSPSIASSFPFSFHLLG